MAEATVAKFCTGKINHGMTDYPCMGAVIVIVLNFGALFVSLE